MKRIAIVGCGKISSIYFKNSAQLFPQVTVTACADLDPERAAAYAREYPDVEATTLEAILADPAIDIVLNLTPPAGHYAVARQVVAAEKSVYNEKPLTITRDEGQALLAQARQKGVLVGSAPDTFLGGGIQTCLELIQEGAIGEPIGAQAFMLSHGPEGWHPDPAFFYQAGSGPLFDMGPYYLTTLVALLGPVRRVTGSARISFPTRTIGSEPKRGQQIQVGAYTHSTGVLEFAGGAIGTITTSFDVWGSAAPRMEIFGSEATLSVPDPNTFRGPVRILRAGCKEWEEVEITRPYTDNSRGLGLADMAAALQKGRPHRANGELAFHVLDIMHAIHDASAQGRHIELASTCDRPEGLPANLGPGEID